MNKYILRTSLFWLIAIAVLLGLFAYRSRQRQQSTSTVAAIEPVAAGPPPQTSSAEPVAPKMEAPLVPVQLSAEQLQDIGVKTGTVEYQQLSDDVRATGTVDIDERLTSFVQVRYPGYIRKVFANATYQYVKKGEPLFTIYSPDLVATQQEYLIARQNQRSTTSSSIDGVATGAAALTDAAERRLKQWEIPESAIAHLKETGTATTDMTVTSTVSGYITERNALPNMYVEPATRLYTIADLSRVWVTAQVFQNDIGRLKPGDIAQITVDAYPVRTFTGHIEDIVPQVDMTTRTVRVRIAVNNPGVKLKPGMFVNVDVKSALGRQLVVPASAVFQTGTRQLVFLDHGNGNLEPKDIVLGTRVGDSFVVLKGVTAHEPIVTSANFLIDSESQFQAASGSNTPTTPRASDTAPQEKAQPADALGIAFTTDPDPPHRGSNRFRVKLASANGAAVAGADVTVKFYMAAMPAMGMAALNTSSKLTQSGNGLYEGTGQLESGGTWQVTITVTQNGQTLATKQLRINAEGGM